MNLKKKKNIPDQNKLRARYNECRAEYDAALRIMTRRVRGILSRHDINSSLHFRLKSFDSYYAKLLRQTADNPGRNSLIGDMIGLRIICPFLEDLETVERLLADNLTVTEIEHKGADRSLMEFAYDSIHVMVELPAGVPRNLIPHTARICEIQIRTILQEAWAEVEHELIYKAEFSLLNDPVKRKLASLNAMLSLSDIIFQEIRDFQKEVREKDRKRRESLESKIQVIDTLSLLDTEKGPRILMDEESEILPMNPRNDMERLIFEALDLHSRGNLAAAIRTYTRILGMKPPDMVRSVILNHRGMAHFVLSRYAKAAADFTSAIGADPGNYRALNHRGLTRRMLKDYSGAIDDFTGSLLINDTQTDGYYSRALTYHDLGNLTAALEDCVRVLAIKPDHGPAQRLKEMIEKELFS